MTLILPTEDQLRNMYKQLNMTPEGIERDVKYLKEWISQQPHLPDGIDERWLRNSLIFRKNSLEKVKESLDLFYSAKSHVPELFSNRDPLNRALQEQINNFFCYPFPRLTPDGSRVVLWKLMSDNLKTFNYTLTVKLILMSANIELLEDQCLNHIIVVDMEGISVGHITSVSVALTSKFMFIAQKAYPIRQKAIHFINCPPYIDMLLSIFKPFLKKKIIDRICIHPGGLGNIFNTVPREIFPKDYGGDEITVNELHDKCKKKLVQYRDWFLKDDLLSVDERRRPGKPKTHNDLFGFEGSFRQLCVD